MRVEFAEAVAKDRATQAGAEILKIVLYGSYARGDYLEAPSPFDGYQSDFDLLVVVNEEDYAEHVTCSGADEWFHRLIRVPVSLTAHGLDFVNHALSRHRCFFTDILKEGIVIYQTPGHPFAEPPPLTPALAHDVANEHYRVWFRDGKSAWKTLLDHIEDGRNGHIAVTLHRRVEELYNALLLVLTFYSPGGHDLARLRDLAEAQDGRLTVTWPRDTPAVRRRFDRFKRAFLKDTTLQIDDYSAEEVAWIAERVERLENLAGTICRERLAELAAAAEGS